jgi:anti-sigma factor RsiW
MSEAERCLTDDQLQEWLDGEMDPARAANASAHAGQCARCSGRALAYQQLFASLARLEAPAPERNLVGPVLARIEPGAAEGIRRWFPWVLGGQVALAGAVLALSWSYIIELVRAWRAASAFPAAAAWLHTALSVVQEVPSGMSWESARQAIESLPDRILAPWAVTWPTWGFLLGMSFLLWSGVNGWVLRRQGVSPAGTGERSIDRNADGLRLSGGGG